MSMVYDLYAKDTFLRGKAVWSGEGIKNIPFV